MKLDFTHLQKLVSQVPDLISKGQSIIEKTQSAVEVVQRFKGTQPINDDKEDAEGGNTEAEATNSYTSASKIESPDLTSQIASGVVALSNPLSVAETIKEMVHQANETIQFCEQQETVRTEIRANAAIEISKINAMADMVRDYLKRSFDERAGLFDNYFTVLDNALEKGDNNLIAQTLQSINSLAASSPFKDLADLNKVSACLSEGGEWDI